MFKKKLYDPSIIVPKDLEAAHQVMRKFIQLAKKNGAYAIDTETGGLSWIRDPLYMVSLYTPGLSVAIPVAWQDYQLTSHDLPRLLNPLTTNTDILHYLHNAKFDMHFLLSAGVVFSGEVHDTCVAGFNVDVRRPAKLKLRAKADCGIIMTDFKDRFKIGGRDKLTLLDYEARSVAGYAVLDAFATYSLADKFFERGEFVKYSNSVKLRANDEDISLLYDKVDSQMMRILFDMERRGIRVDRPAVEAKRNEIIPELAKLEKDIIKEAGAVFNMRSPKQVKEVFGRRGFHDLESTDEAHLKVLANGGDALARLMMAYREKHKIQTTYLESILAVLDKNDRLHTSFNLHIAETGRLSSSGDANMQNQPKEEWMRRFFIASPGKKLIVRDYSQIELRILAIVAEDKVMLQEYMDGADVHRLNAAKMYNKDPKDVTDEERQSAKAGLSFGVIYGMSPRALAAMLKITEEKAELMIAAVFKKYKGVDVWQKRTKQSAMNVGYVKTTFGRRRDLDNLKSGDRGQVNYGLREAVNTCIQGGAADFVKLAMIQIDNDKEFKDLGGAMLLQVHDEIVAEAPEETAMQVDARMAHLMENFAVAKKMPIPFPTEGGVGENWWTAKKGGNGDPPRTKPRFRRTK